jgi:hypothetical protein
VIGWLFSPIGRWLSAVGSFVAFVALVYWEGRKRGVEKLRAEQEAEKNRRMTNALEADHRVRGDIAAGRLRDNDGHRRD